MLGQPSKLRRSGVSETECFMKNVQPFTEMYFLFPFLTMYHCNERVTVHKRDRTHCLECLKPKAQGYGGDKFSLLQTKCCPLSVFFSANPSRVSSLQVTGA